ncbi:putative PHD finger domain protein [Aspergillus clavatus NRRL 1]|uniref:Chromatin modification-related protein n=1 Tax=Aspergillus clavatus (strain ATCC 1007 / CBS 513.65 / DSM 816 / NCTC 3887 / NRRL 1 / QM 1276 / 107) TaxID=344612 RepID=A1CKU0_ASPCL|nr:PHD finger domain protein, putative [Aspergillus clavatus NRRL 1]EAW09764.1 PHD finger domain protein, putative [Aspergillus clavatus NRRL 1]
MIMADYNDEDGGVILDGPFDPDAQATVTDYIDYTEYLPADLIRSLTLIRGLDERYLEATQNVHELTTTWGQLPERPPSERPDAQTLRKNISAQLDRAINARESAYAEACRLYDVVDRHFNRLDCIKQKLQALPKPESRDPTPPTTQAAPNTKRGRFTKKAEPAAPTTTRIKLRLDGPARAASRPAQRSRSRRGVLAAEHLAGLHPDNPIASTEHSDEENEAQASPEPTPEEPVPVKGKKEKPPRRSRTSGPSTNGPAQGPTMSTSNALAMLRPPPEDAKPGSEDLPWLRLTDWEMTKLRKKMKKNAVWQPSEVMIHRELALRGRGWDAYRTAKAEAEANGTDFLDCDDIMNNFVPGMLTRLSDANGLEGVMETKLSNRGMKLNEAKKLKRENMAREQAAAAAAAAQAEAKRRAEAGITDAAASPDRSQGAVTTGKSSRILKKRRADESAAVEAASAPPAESETRGSLRSSKRRRTNREMPGESPVEDSGGASSEPADTATATTANAETIEIRKPSPVPSTASTAAAQLKEGKTSTPPASRPPSRHLAPAAATDVAGKDLRRKSATPARRTPVPDGSRAPSVSAPIRRRKRPAPGPVSSGRDGGAAVSYGRRKAKPAKKRIGPREQGQKDGTREDIRIDEDGVLEEIDPNEPRYCLCGDVSFGTMICCENPDCDREWFHLDCVGLSEVPSRTAKWYCPDCRVKFNKGTDGIVKQSSRR